MRAGEREAGCTVHYVSPEIDAGEIILQKSIEVDYSGRHMAIGRACFHPERQTAGRGRYMEIKAENGRNDGV